MNCTHPELECKSINKHHDRSDCDCRWCVYNREYCKANISEDE
jgi:hypothetical protein